MLNLIMLGEKENLRGLEMPQTELRDTIAALTNIMSMEAGNFR